MPSVSSISKYLYILIIVTVRRILKLINHFLFSSHFITFPWFNNDILPVPIQPPTQGTESQRGYASDTLHTKSLWPGDAGARVPSGSAPAPTHFISLGFSLCCAFIQLHPALTSDYA